MKAIATLVDWNEPSKEVHEPIIVYGRTRIQCGCMANDIAKALKCMVGSIKFSKV